MEAIEMGIYTFLALVAIASAIGLIIGLNDLDKQKNNMYVNKDEYDSMRKWIIMRKRLKRLPRSIRQKVNRSILFVYLSSVAIKAKICTYLTDLFK